MGGLSVTGPQRLAAWIAGGVVVGLLLVLLWNFDPFGRRKRAELRADTAQVAETLATKTAQITERTFTKETIIREQGEAIVQTVEAAPGAETLIPDAVLSAWSDGIERLRNDAGAGGDPGSSRPTEPLS